MTDLVSHFADDCIIRLFFRRPLTVFSLGAGRLSTVVLLLASPALH